MKPASPMPPMPVTTISESCHKCRKIRKSRTLRARSRRHRADNPVDSKARANVVPNHHTTTCVSGIPCFDASGLITDDEGMPVSLLDGYATTPARQGLYDPQFERDACGVALVATLSGVPSNDVVKQALTALENLEHRGASGSEPDSGDGAGILIQVPDALLRRVSGIELPEPGAYATGVGFFPTGGPTRDSLMAQIDEIARDEEIAILGWRCVPTDPSLVGVTARECMPDFWQIFAVDARNATSDSTSTGACTRCASEWRTSWASTSRHCLLAPWSTRAC